jgi:hypothetical protein
MFFFLSVTARLLFSMTKLIFNDYQVITYCQSIHGLVQVIYLAANY